MEVSPESLKSKIMGQLGLGKQDNIWINHHHRLSDPDWFGAFYNLLPHLDVCPPCLCTKCPPHLEQNGLFAISFSNLPDSMNLPTMMMIIIMVIVMIIWPADAFWRGAIPLPDGLPLVFLAQQGQLVILKYKKWKIKMKIEMKNNLRECHPVFYLNKVTCPVFYPLLNLVWQKISQCQKYIF